MLAAPRASSSYVPVTGGLLHVVDHGGPAGAPAVVLVHGVTGSAATWHGVAGGLTDLGRVLAVDLRGHGASWWAADGDYTTVGHADDLVAVLDAFGVERAVLVGSSWGALVALAVADRRPERVRALALVDVEPSFAQSDTDVPPRARSFPDLDAAAAQLRALNPHAPDTLLHLVAAESTVAAADGSRVPAHDPVLFERWPFRADDWWDALPRIRVPCLVVHAGASFTRREVTERMASLVPGGRHVEIDDCAHVVPLDRPAELTAVLRELLVTAGG